MNTEIERLDGCTALNRAGRRCSYRARPGTHPPVCGKHIRAGRPAAAPTLYATGLTAGELALLAESESSHDLSSELTLVRAVLLRLLARLDDPAYVLLPSDLRQLAGLIFSGARTVAQLLRQQQSDSSDAQPWLQSALDEIAAATGYDL